MKVLRVIKNIILAILGTVYFSFVLAMSILLLNYNDFGVTQFDNTTLIILKDEVTSDKYQKGDLLLVNYKPIEKIVEGDELFVYKVEKNKPTGIDFGNVGTISKEDNAIAFANGGTYSMDFAIGGVTKVYPEIGKYLGFIESKWVFLFVIIVPCFLIFVYEVYELIVEIKYGGKDDDDEEEEKPKKKKVKKEKIKPKKEKEKKEVIEEIDDYDYDEDDE